MRALQPTGALAKDARVIPSHLLTMLPPLMRLGQGDSFPGAARGRGPFRTAAQ
jgi:hypothetical protein